jgi:DNA excision repair protein ERCC-5
MIIRRDDDGKIVKNAHLIGTLRRILKLLFHRIKPVFVFDGETPALKLKTSLKRRKIRERQEINLRATAQKLLLSQLKQRIIHEKSSTLNKENTEKVTNDENVSHVTDDSTVKSRDPESMRVHQVNNENENVEWEDGYSHFVEKDIDSDSDNEVSWDIPENGEFNIEVLAAIPSHYRKDIIEETRKRERQKKRSTYIPVANNPQLYSQTQLANFLRSR